MTGPQAKRMVVVGLVGVGTLAAIEALAAGEQPSPRIAVGVVGTAVILAGLAEVAPTVAGGTAALIFVTAGFVYGAPAWRAVSKVTNPNRKAAT